MSIVSPQHDPHHGLLNFSTFQQTPMSPDGVKPVPPSMMVIYPQPALWPATDGNDSDSNNSTGTNSTSSSTLTNQGEEVLDFLQETEDVPGFMQTNGATYYENQTDNKNDRDDDQMSFTTERRVQRQERNAKRGLELTESPANIEELMEEAALKRRRLARKAELARVSRKRKKMKIEDLEGEVAELQAALAQANARATAAEAKLAAAAAAAPVPAAAPVLPTAVANTEAPQGAQEKLAAAIKQMLSASEAEAGSAAESFMTAVKSAAAQEESQLDALVSQNRNTVLPLQFVRWALSQNDKFYSDSTGLWSSLLKQDLGATPQQLEQLQALRPVATSTQEAGKKMAADLAALQQVWKAHARDTQQNLADFMSVLKPDQLVKLFQWVERYGSVCVKINL